MRRSKGGAWAERVGVQVLYEACGTCEYCLTSREHLCLKAKVTGETVDGGFAELIAAPSDFVYAVPDNLSDQEAAPLFCPGVTAYRAVKRAGVRMGDKVVVMGVGGVGHLSLQFAKLAGAEVIAVDESRGPWIPREISEPTWPSRPRSLKGNWRSTKGPM